MNTARKVRIGVIGAGWWATAVQLPALKADSRVEIAAVSRLGAAELEKVRIEFSASSAFLDYREMLAREKLDGVIIASPHPLHYEHARAALDHGAHVLVEKPMTTNAADARALVARAAELQREIMVAYGWNFTPIAHEARRFLAAGLIGDIRHVSLHMASALDDLFSGEGLMEAQNALFQPAASTWADPRRAGGYAWGQLTHALGLLFSIVDLDPAEVFAMARRSPTGVDAYDAVVVRFGNGSIGAVSGAATVPKHLSFQIDLRIFGSAGMLLLDMERERLEVRRHDQADTVVPLKTGAGAYPSAAPVEAFVNLCCGDGQGNPSPGIVGLRSTQFIEAFHRSLASHQLEKTDLPLNS
jgi:predicted dehydrogenase